MIKKRLICAIVAFYLTKECTADNRQCLRLVSDSCNDKRCQAPGNLDLYQGFCPPHHRYVCLEDAEESVIAFCMPDNLECEPDGSCVCGLGHCSDDENKCVPNVDSTEKCLLRQSTKKSVNTVPSNVCTSKGYFKASFAYACWSNPEYGCKFHHGTVFALFRFHGVTQSEQFLQLTLIINPIHVLPVMVVVGIGIGVIVHFAMRRKNSITKNKYFKQTHYHGNIIYHNNRNQNSESEGSEDEEVAGEEET